MFPGFGIHNSDVEQNIIANDAGPGRSGSLYVLLCAIVTTVAMYQLYLQYHLWNGFPSSQLWYSSGVSGAVEVSYIQFCIAFSMVRNDR